MPKHLLSRFIVCHAAFIFIVSYLFILSLQACPEPPKKDHSGQTRNSRPFSLLDQFYDLRHILQNLHQKYCLRLRTFHKNLLRPCCTVPHYGSCRIPYDNIRLQHCYHLPVCLDSGLPVPGLNLFQMGFTDTDCLR